MFDHTVLTSFQLLPDSFNSTPAQLYVLKNYHLPSPICAAQKLIGMWSFTGTWSTFQGLQPSRKLSFPSPSVINSENLAMLVGHEHRSHAGCDGDWPGSCRSHAGNHSHCVLMSAGPVTSRGDRSLISLVSSSPVPTSGSYNLSAPSSPVVSWGDGM